MPKNRTRGLFNNNGDSPNDNTLLVENSIVRQFKERLAVQASTVFPLTCLLGQPFLLHSIRLGHLKIFFCKFSLSFSNLCQADFDFMGASIGISPDPALGEYPAPGVMGSLIRKRSLHFPESTGEIPNSPIELPLDSVELDSVVLVDGSESFLISDVGLALTPNNNGGSSNSSTFLGGGQYCAALEVFQA